MKAATRSQQAAAAHYWYALKVPPQKEFAAREILRKRGLTTFIPVEKKWRRRNKYTKEKVLIQYPIFPRYVFTGFPKAAANWFDVFKIHLIQGVVGINGEPRKLDEAGMARMLFKFEDGLARPKEEKWMPTNHEFKVGDVVEVMDGPFEGQKVPVVDIVGSDAKIMISLFGGERVISAPLAILAA